MIGSATWRDSTLASSRPKPRARAAASVAPLRDTPGISAQAWARPRQSASTRAGVFAAALPVARRVGREHRQRAGDEPGGDRRGRAEAALDRALEDVADDRRRHEAQDDQLDAAAVERARRLGDLVAQADEQRRRGAGVERDLERLAQLAVEAGCRASRTATARRRRGPRRRSAAARPARAAARGRARRACAAALGSSAAAGIGGRLGRADRCVAAAAASALDDQVGDPDDDAGGHEVVEVVQRVLPVRPVLADLLADERRA